ncbi:unnamed protein product [Hermetia illucens]|uniref:PHD finger protein rhinoceros n=1 Tax=Hermetia illucens TaxID=343691 RepID=A0A7R8UM75_HERIL|nr:PHD finger protein rhinoceros [Hermetia illucens]CAD7083396.1 unnamed protein product [Hermetia illucens]
MSQRGKRGNRLDNENNAHQQTQQPPSKRRKGRPPTTSNGDADQEVPTSATTIPVVSAGVQPNLSSAASSSSSTMWQARPITGPQIYNRNSSEAPAELFRKDLISAMKLPDSEPLSTDEYWVIVDQWKQEWERGVQVPVNPDSLPEPSVKQLSSPIAVTRHDFKLPKNKYLRITKDENFSSEQHFLSNAPALAESACSYDLDQVDEVWLKLVNSERLLSGVPAISEGQFERVIEELEVRCWEKIQAIMRNEEGLGIEYDENVICDVCRSPDSEEANEMVFCDNCNICVHQACYGITVIPSGQWLCRTCSMGKKPDCALCPNKGGAMKSTRSGKKWAHVSCALWIPEVSIGCVDKMEPITKISSIPQTRWSLLCILCRERVGACIQCSVSTCKTAYHVTCAFQHGLEMRAIIEEGNAEDGVKLRSYCLKHCNAKGKKEKGTNNNGSGSDDDCRRRKMRSDMTSEERNQARLMRSKEVEAEFDKHVNIKDISCHLLDVDQEAITSIYSYWILKRKSANNRPLIPPKVDDTDMVPNRQDQADNEKKIMFVHLRQDLERVRNLCYMVNRREKLSRTFFKMREQIFHKQIAILSESSCRNYDESVISAIIQANNGSSVYDKCYSSTSSGSPTINVEELQERILGAQQMFDSGVANIAAGAEKKKKGPNASSRHNFKKIHLNGISDRKAADSVYEDSSMSSNSEAPDKYRPNADSSTAPAKKKAQSYSKILEKHKRRKSMASSIAVDSSSDEEDMRRERSGPKKNPSLHQMEKELAIDGEQMLTSSDDSDLLMPIRQTNNQLTSKKSHKPIYSDSDSTDKEKTDNTVSDSQQQMFRTKAAMKEFSLQQAASKHKQDVVVKKSSSPTKNASKTVQNSNNKHKSSPEVKKSIEKPVKVKPKEKVQVESDTDERNDKKDTSRKQLKSNDIESPTKVQSKDVNNKKFPTDLLVVPQRQAAKKASENMRSTNSYVSAVGQKKDSRDGKLDEKELESPTVKNKEKSKDKEKEAKEDDREKEKDKDKDKEKAKPRGRPPKHPKEDPKEKHIADKEKEASHKEKEKEKRIEVPPVQQKTPVEVPQKNEKPPHRKSEKTDSQLIVAYVPQRQAAKKAAEHIKSGMGKSSTSETSTLVEDKEKEQVKEKDKEKDKVDKEKDGKNKNEMDAFREKCREKDKEKPRDIKCDTRDKDLEKGRHSEKDEKSVSPPKMSNAQIQRADRRSRGSISAEDVVKEKPPSKPPPDRRRSKSRIVLESSSSESSSSSSYSSSSSESEDENDDSLSREKDEAVSCKDTKPVSPGSRDSPSEKKELENEALPEMQDDLKNVENIVSTPKTVDSDVLCIDDSPEDIDKKSSVEHIPMDLETTPANLDDEKQLDVKPEEKEPYEADSILKAKEKSPFVETEDSDEKPASLAEQVDENNVSTSKTLDELNPEKENTQTLEEEMAQRKADLTCFPMGGFKSKTNKNSGSLDKLLNRKEKERKEQKDLEKVADAMEIDDSLKSEDVDVKLKTPPVEEVLDSAQQLLSLNKPSVMPANVTEIIDIDSESGESDRSKADSERPVEEEEKSQEIEMKSSSIPLSLSSFLPADISRDFTLRAESLKQKQSSPAPYEQPDREESVKHQFLEDLPNNNKSVCDFTMDPIFNAKPSEDSARETMNLVEKLRQNKYKRSSSKADDIAPPSAEIRENDTKLSSSNTFNYNADMFSPPMPPVHDLKGFGAADRIAAPKERPPSIFDKETASKLDIPVSKGTPVFDQHVPNVDSAINFFDKTQLACEVTPTSAQPTSALSQTKNSAFPLSSATDSVGDIGKTSDMFLPPESLDKARAVGSRPTDSFDSLAQSNFFKGDFVDMRAEKESLDVSTNSSKLVVDCEYDENTRMQSPYTNPENIWNENNLIQTRRSVSSSPSSISESNDEMPVAKASANVNEMPVRKTNETPLQEKLDKQPQHQQERGLGAMSCGAESMVEKSNFNLVSSFGSITQSQFSLQSHPQQITQHQSSHQPLPHQHQPVQQHSQHQQPPQAPLSFMNGADVMPYNYSEDNHYNGPVSLFPSQSVPSSMNTQMPPFPSPSTPIFPPSLSTAMPLSQNPQSTSSIFGHLDKPKHSTESSLQYSLLTQPCAATFTSSSDNLALTQELVSNNVSSVPLTSSQIMNNTYTMPTAVESVGSNNTSDPTNSLNHIMNCEVLANNAVNAKDSPSKRSSARFNQIKSPSMHKSPGKSPRNMELLSRQHSQSNNQKGKYESGQRSKSKSTRGGNSGRARGRGRGRGRLVSTVQMAQNMDFESSMGSIANNLAGTVYDLDFDEDLGTSVDLKSLRDRRKSFDSRVNAVSTCEQKFTSPGYQGKLRNTLLSTKSVSDVKSPNMGSSESAMHASHSYLSNIHPVLPGPVDMRTYNSGYENQSSTNQEAYNNHLLGVFATGMGDQTLNEIDEEDEEKLQSVLKASGTYKAKPPVADIVVPESHASIETTSEEISIDSDNTISKVSLSDSRNQLKLKIKGPLARPENYNAQSTSGSLNQSLGSDNMGLQMSAASNVTMASSSNPTGTSSLRRMRKKELLRQYWTQDMNMDDGASLPPIENKVINDPILSRSVGIPKAVDSMSSIPTKEDYKDYASMDPRKRKRSQGLSRELRQLDMPYESERPERRRSVCSSGSNISVNNVGDPIKVSLKRRKTKLDSPNNTEAPKLKIKIGNHIETISDGNRMIGYPPKKRPTSNPQVPSLEILKRESMNFRKQVMADFDEEEGEKMKRPKVKAKKNSKSPSHKKRKKDKREHSQKMESIQGAEAPKIIIRFGGGSASTANTVVVDPTTTARTGASELSESSSNAVNTASPSVMPIKLKIARNSDGGGYVIGKSKRLETDDSSTPAQRSDESSYTSTFGNRMQMGTNSGCNYNIEPPVSNYTLGPSVSEGDSVTPSTMFNVSRVGDSGDQITAPIATSNSENTSTVNVQILAPNKANSDLKGGQTKSSKGCPLLPINKDCEVR